MALEVGMYVRTERGKIWLVESTKAIDGHKRRIVNADYDILKLIRVGDYVNGYEVYKIFLTDAVLVKNKDYPLICRSEIKSIVTKEQFEQIQYKVGE